MDSSTAKIFKYPVKGDGELTSISCRRHQLLDIQRQDNELVCWIEIRDDLPETTTELISIGTGWAMPSEFMDNATYFKTVQDAYGFVWHFYEVKNIDLRSLNG